MKLFEIAEEFERVMFFEVDRETGEVTDETLEKLDELKMALDEKALACAAYVKGERAEAEAVKAQADKLVERARRHKARADRLVEYIARNLPEGTKLSSDVAEIMFRKNPPSVVIEDEGKLGPEYFRVTRTPDKTKIKDALKAGEVDGARLVQRSSLVVK